ncbi:integumentary mucin C.1-like [Sitodiplosis mosellana]|uniref:integumentary mucin C.1-like n=1 Tax=Sitodiplosis mosellana TaxID=263140 RepID=UPI002443D4E7|nr:integumentary mucin C.1-like [Sitodiplosis mosellana]
MDINVIVAVVIYAAVFQVVLSAHFGEVPDSKPTEWTETTETTTPDYTTTTEEPGSSTSDSPSTEEPATTSEPNTTDPPTTPPTTTTTEGTTEETTTEGIVTTTNPHKGTPLPHNEFSNEYFANNVKNYYANEMDYL